MTEIFVEIPELCAPFRAAHLSDSHLMRFSPAERFAGPMRARCDGWAGSERFEARFQSALAAAKKAADWIFHTGDWCDFPSRDNLEAMAREPEIAWVSGNHDWSFPGEMPDQNAKSRGEEVLQPLGYAPFWARERGGVRFLGLDNSTYAITPAQLAFLGRELENGPCVLLVHVPFSAPELREKTVQKWGAPILMGEKFSPEHRAAWGVWDEQNATREALELCRRSENLRAIFAGHVHFFHAERWGAATQFVAAPAFGGEWNLVRFERA